MDDFVTAYCSGSHYGTIRSSCWLTVIWSPIKNASVATHREEDAYAVSNGATLHPVKSGFVRVMTERITIQTGYV